MYDVITIGSATVDFFADTDSELIKIQSRNSKEEMIAFPLSSKLLINQLDIRTGGGGTNSAVSFARLGLKTGFLGKMGEDANADFIEKQLQEEGIEFLGSRGGVTGISIVLNGLEKDRTILAYKGANNTLTMDEIDGLPDSRWIYLSSMLDTSFETVSELIANSEHKVAFNPSNYQVEKGLEKIETLLNSVDVLMMNKEEACKLMGMDYTTDPDIRDIFEAMSKLAPEVFVVTNGGNGAFVYENGTIYRGKPNPDCVAAETTGAGDAFSSTFVASLAMGEPVDKAISLAMTNAESVLQFKGAKERLLSKDELYEKVKERGREIEKL